MNTAIEQNGKIPKECQHGLLLAVTSDKNCVGVRLFPKNIQINENSDARLDKYIDQSLKRALELKSLIEDGRCDIASNSDIVQNSFSKFTDSESLIRTRSKRLEIIRLIEVENQFIDLARIMIKSVQDGKCQLDITEICLGEMYRRSKRLLTPLMLKKNPQIVRAVSKLCCYSVANNGQFGQPLTQCSKIRSYANKTFVGFKTLMGFENVTNEEFLEWFNDSVNLFRELTASLNYDEKRRLTDDPEISLATRIVA